jgi:hypothetical protein
MPFFRRTAATLASIWITSTAAWAGNVGTYQVARVCGAVPESKSFIGWAILDTTDGSVMFCDAACDLTPSVLPSQPRGPAGRFAFSSGTTFDKYCPTPPPQSEAGVSFIDTETGTLFSAWIARENVGSALIRRVCQKRLLGEADFMKCK